MCGLPLVVAGGSGPALMGKNWQSHIQLNWRQMNQVHNASLHSLLSKYPGVFQKGLGTLKGFKARIYVDPETPPRFNHAHSVPYALRDKVLFRYTRLSFGISSTPGIFQHVIESILHGMKGVVVYLLIAGPTKEAHLRTLDKVLTGLGLELKSPNMSS